MWQESIQAIDELIELYKQDASIHPEHRDFYERRIAVKMKKKLLAEEALRLSEKLRDTVDEYLAPEQEQQA